MFRRFRHDGKAGFNVYTLYLSCLVFIAYMFLLSLEDEAMLGVGLCLPGRDLVRSEGVYSVDCGH